MEINREREYISNEVIFEVSENIYLPRVNDIYIYIYNTSFICEIRNTYEEYLMQIVI